MRSHAALLRRSPPKTACSASTECGGRRSDSIWASPGAARAKRSDAVAIRLLSPRGAGATLPNVASGECVTLLSLPQYAFLWTSCGKENKSRVARQVSQRRCQAKEKKPPGGGLFHDENALRLRRPRA